MARFLQQSVTGPAAGTNPLAPFSPLLCSMEHASTRSSHAITMPHTKSALQPGDCSASLDSDWIELIAERDIEALPKDVNAVLPELRARLGSGKPVLSEFFWKPDHWSQAMPPLIPNPEAAVFVVDCSPKLEIQEVYRWQRECAPALESKLYTLWSMTYNNRTFKARLYTLWKQFSILDVEERPVALQAPGQEHSSLSQLSATIDTSAFSDPLRTMLHNLANHYQKLLPGQKELLASILLKFNATNVKSEEDMLAGVLLKLSAPHPRLHEDASVPSQFLNAGALAPLAGSSFARDLSTTQPAKRQKSDDLLLQTTESLFMEPVLDRPRPQPAVVASVSGSHPVGSTKKPRADSHALVTSSRRTKKQVPWLAAARAIAELRSLLENSTETSFDTATLADKLRRAIPLGKVLHTGNECCLATQTSAPPNVPTQPGWYLVGGSGTKFYHRDDKLGEVIQWHRDGGAPEGDVARFTRWKSKDVNYRARYYDFVKGYYILVVEEVESKDYP